MLEAAFDIVEEQALLRKLQRTKTKMQQLLQNQKEATLEEVDEAFQDFSQQYKKKKASLTHNTRSKIEDVLLELQTQRNLVAQCRNQDTSGLEHSYKDFEYLNGVPLHPGDVMMAIRQAGLYQHFAIYAGQQQVIHYAADNGDFGSPPSIRLAPFTDFQLTSRQIYILDFPQHCGHPSIRLAKGKGQGWYKKEFDDEFPLFTLIRSAFYHLYSSEETLSRARSRLGETKYTLPFNNCEHFAIWCKTGVAESYQVNSLISKLLKNI